MRRLGQSLAILPAYQSATVLADAPPTFTEVGLVTAAIARMVLTETN